MNKSVRIENLMREKIRNGEWAQNTKIPTETVLCTQFAVSRNTVRSALSVLRAEGTLISRPRVGTLVASNARQKTIYLIVGQVNNPIEAAFVRYFVRFGSTRTEYNVKFYESGFDIKREIRLLTAALKDPDSVVLISSLVSEQARKLLSSNPSRCAILGVAPELFGICCQVQTDIQAGTEQLMDYLLEMGHRNIAYLGSYFDGLRYQVWRERLTRIGNPPPEAMSAIAEAECCFNIGARTRFASRFLKRIMAGEIPCSAVFCVSDVWAASLLHAAAVLGVKIPKDLSVVGFDGLYLEEDSYDNMSITTMVQPFERIFTAALNALENFTGESVRIFVKPEMFVGNSVARCNGK